MKTVNEDDLCLALTYKECKDIYERLDGMQDILMDLSAMVNGECVPTRATLDMVLGRMLTCVFDEKRVYIDAINSYEKTQD